MHRAPQEEDNNSTAAEEGNGRKRALCRCRISPLVGQRQEVHTQDPLREYTTQGTYTNESEGACTNIFGFRFWVTIG